MTPAAVIAMLATPGVWTCVNLDPLAICQPTLDVCVTGSAHELLVSQREADTVTITPLSGHMADVAWNLVVLRAADALALARDRAERRRQEQRGDTP